MFFKNTANQWVGFALISQADGGGLPGLTPLAWVSKNGVPHVLGLGVVRDGGNGAYLYGPTQAETNCAQLSIILTAPGAVPMEKTVFPFDLTVGVMGVILEQIGSAPFGPEATVKVDPAEGLLLADLGGGAAQLRIQNAGPTQTGTMNATTQTIGGAKQFTGNSGVRLTNGFLYAKDPAFPTTNAALGMFTGKAYVGSNEPSELTFCDLIFIQASAGLSIAFLQGRQAGFGPTETALALVDAAGVPHVGVPGTLSDGSTVYGGLITSVGTGGITSAGVYTPVVTPVANVGVVTARPFQWMRVGSTVTVSGVVDMTAAAPGPVSQWLLSLPVPSVLTAVEQLAGTGLPDQAGAPLQGPVSVEGDVPSAGALMGTIQGGFVTPTPYFVHFTYQVL